MWPYVRDYCRVWQRGHYRCTQKRYGLVPRPLDLQTGFRRERRYGIHYYLYAAPAGVYNPTTSYIDSGRRIFGGSRGDDHLEAYQSIEGSYWETHDDKESGIAHVTSFHNHKLIGVDYLYGSDGNDVYKGGDGINLLIGARGKKDFHLAEDGVAFIIGFKEGQDLLVFTTKHRAIGSNPAEGVLNAITDKQEDYATEVEFRYDGRHTHVRIKYGSKWREIAILLDTKVKDPQSLIKGRDCNNLTMSETPFCAQRTSCVGRERIKVTAIGETHYESDKDVGTVQQKLMDKIPERIQNIINGDKARETVEEYRKNAHKLPLEEQNKIKNYE